MAATLFQFVGGYCFMSSYHSAFPFVLQIILIHREAPAADLGDMAHDEKAGGVDAVSQLFQPGQLPVGHDAQ